MINNEERIKLMRKTIEKFIADTAELLIIDTNEENKQFHVGTLSGFIRCWNLFDNEELKIVVDGYGLDEE